MITMRVKRKDFWKKCKTISMEQAICLHSLILKESHLQKPLRQTDILALIQTTFVRALNGCRKGGKATIGEKKPVARGHPRSIISKYQWN